MTTPSHSTLPHLGSICNLAPLAPHAYILVLSFVSCPLSFVGWFLFAVPRIAICSSSKKKKKNHRGHLSSPDLRTTFPRVWLPFLDPTIHPPIVVTAWRILHGTIGCKAYLTHVRSRRDLEIRLMLLAPPRAATHPTSQRISHTPSSPAPRFSRSSNFFWGGGELEQITILGTAKRNQPTKDKGQETKNRTKSHLEDPLLQDRVFTPRS